MSAAAQELSPTPGPSRGNSEIPAPREPRPGQAWSVQRWILDSDMPKGTLYEMWAAGRGPRYVQVGRRRKVIESPVDFYLRIGRAV